MEEAVYGLLHELNSCLGRSQRRPEDEGAEGRLKLLGALGAGRDGTTAVGAV